VSDGHTPDPTRLVADADVLAADLLVGGAARETLDTVRAHSWLELVATEPLLDDAEAVIETLADPGLAADWRAAIADLATLVEQPDGDHPALSAAYRGDAAHVVSLDERLTSVEAGANLKGILDVSVRSPDAFRAVVDPAALYELAFEDSYPGPDREPRA
jgi:hypothetical protein